MWRKTDDFLEPNDIWTWKLIHTSIDFKSKVSFYVQISVGSRKSSVLRHMYRTIYVFYNFCCRLKIWKYQAFNTCVAKLMISSSQLIFWPSKLTLSVKSTPILISFDVKLIIQLQQIITFPTHASNAWCFQAKPKLLTKKFTHECFPSKQKMWETKSTVQSALKTKGVGRYYRWFLSCLSQKIRKAKPQMKKEKNCSIMNVMLLVSLLYVLVVVAHVPPPLIRFIGS